MSQAGTVRCLICFLTLACLFSPTGVAPAAEVGFRQIDLQVSRIDTFAIAFSDNPPGSLEFRGGLVLASPDDDFGALSGLDFMPDGSLVAVADTGFWFTARLLEQDGRLSGLVDARIAPILDAGGKPVKGKNASDAEGLRILDSAAGIEAYVSFERRNDLRRFTASPDLARARATPVRLPNAIRGLNRNEGLEAVAIAPKAGPYSGAIVLVAEHTLDKDGNHRGWIVGGPRAGSFSVKRSEEFDVTDAAFLPNNDLIILERRFSFAAGVGMRIRRIAAADLWPGRIVDGRVLVNADMRYQIDNMEGMALRTSATGETLITLVSDNNKNFVQRTILLQFALAADAPPIPRSNRDR